MPLIFEEVKLDCGYRIDLLVENKLVIEIKRFKKMRVIKHDQIQLQNDFFAYSKKIYTIEIAVIIAVYIISKVF